MIPGKRGSFTVVRKIYLYRASDGAFLRSIPTDAKASITSLDFSRDGQLIASMDELAYSSGGRARVFRVSKGTRVTVPAASAKSTAVEFSPDGQFLAANNVNVMANGIAGGVRVFRTSNWTSVMTVSGGDKLVHWSADGATIWTTKNHFDVACLDPNFC